MRPATRHLFEQGRYAAALESLRHVVNPSVDEKLARCQSEAIVGERGQAFDFAVELLASHPPAEVAAVALTVAGRLDFTFSRPQDGHTKFRRALQLASTTQSPRLAASVHSEYVRALLHFDSLESASGHLSALRRAAIRSGHPEDLLILHTLIAEAEAKSGRFARALRELELANIHAPSVPNALRLANLELLSSAIQANVGHTSVALEHAKNATQLSRTSGASGLEWSAKNNVAHLLTILGQHELAQRTVSELAGTRFPSIDLEIAWRSTQFQLALARGDTASAQLIDSEISSAVDERASTYAYWYNIPRLRYLVTTGRAAQAAEIAVRSLPGVSLTSDRNLLDRSRLAAAEAFAAKAQRQVALDHVSAVALGPLGRLPELLATSERVFSLTSDRLEESAAHLSRSARLFGHVGHVIRRGEALRDIKRLEAAAHTTPQPSDSVPDLTTFYSEAPRSFGRADAPTFDSPERAAAYTTHAAAALVDLMSRPSLAGYELLQLASASGASRSAVLLALDDSRVEPIGWTGTDTVDTALLTPYEQWVTVDLGADRGVEHRAVFRPADQGPARIALLSLQRLVASARSLHASIQAESEKSALWPEQLPEQQLGLVCASESMLELLSTARRIAASSIPVLITGETGTGKELLGKAIHQCSARQRSIFLPFNCTAVPKDMLDSQLFGYRRGAFTGAHDAFKGIIRNAAGGTLFLDEIGEIGLDLQPKLLRFLESNEVHPLGEPAPVPVDVRIVAATNANLDRMVADGTFREDLYYRLNVVRLTIPPLRERREEIPLLIDHFMERAQKEAGKTGLRLADATSEYLLLYGWPGNVRELSNEVRRLVALAESDAVLMPEHLSPKIAATRRTVPVAERPADVNEFVVRRDQPLSAAIEHVERTLIQDALRATGSVDLAAKMLGLSRKGLYLKRQRLKIED